MIFSEKRGEARVSFNRPVGWEGSLLVRTDIMPKYSNLPSGEDTPVLHHLLGSNEMDTFFDPELYVYYLHDSNISGTRHKERLFENSLELSIEKNREIKKLLGWV